MLRIHRLRAILLPLCLAATTSASAAIDVEPVWTVVQLAAKNAEARGGLERLHALYSIRTQGKMLVNGGALELGLVEVRQRPGLLRDEISLQGLTQINATDGKQAWQISPFQGRKDPEKMSADDAKALDEASEIDGPLIDYKQKGSIVEYIGIEDVDGTAAHKLQVTRKDGTVQTVFLDPEHFLEIRLLSRRIEHGVEVVTQTDYGEYAAVDGIYFPFAIASGAKDSTSPAQIQLESVTVNPKIDISIFAMPAASAAAAK